MTSRPLLYGADGLTPIAVESDAAEEAFRSLLMVAFGALKGITPGRPITDGNKLLMYREHVAGAIVNALGRENVENHYGIELRVTDRMGLPNVVAEPGGVQ